MTRNIVKKLKELFNSVSTLAKSNYFKEILERAKELRYGERRPNITNEKIKILFFAYRKPNFTLKKGPRLTSSYGNDAEKLKT